MHQTFLFLTATVGLLIALALALAAFPGAAAALPGEPVSPAPIVKADKPIVEVFP
jgi:hypothetical protein